MIDDYEARLDAAVEELPTEALMVEDDVVLAEPEGETPETPEETPAEEPAEAEKPAEAPAEETEGQEAPEPEKPEVEVPFWERDELPENLNITDREWKGLKRAVRRYRDERQNAEQLYSQIQMKELELAEQNAQLEALKDPDALLSHIAKLKGKSPIEVYHEMTERMIEGEEGKPVTQAEIDALVEKKLQAKQELEEKRRQTMAKSSVDQMKRNLFNEAMQIPVNPQLQEEFPALASQSDAELRADISWAIDWAQQNAPDVPFRQVLKDLDNYKQTQFNERAARLGYQRPVAESQHQTQEEKPVRKAMPPVPGGSARVDYTKLTPEERLKEALGTLPDFEV